MGKETLTLGNTEIEKKKYFSYKTPIFRKDVDIEELLVSKKIYFDEKKYKYFTGYLYNNHKVKPLQITLPKTSAYVKIYAGQIKRMHFLIEDDELLEKYNTIWEKASADIKKGFDSAPIYNKKF